MKPTKPSLPNPFAVRCSLLAITICSGLAIRASEPTLTPVGGYPAFALGADVSWTPYIEHNNLHTYYKYQNYTPAGVTDVAALVADHGIDAVRLRVWVDPTTDVAVSGFQFTAYGYEYDEMSTYGTCSVDEMVALATRFAHQGQRLMVVFQMSDSWADPGRQFVPSSWAGCTDITSLSDRVTAHVTDVLTRLHDANVNVAWVQIGNETNTGMLRWPMPATATGLYNPAAAPCSCEIAGSASSPSASTYNFVKIFSDAAAVARDIYPDTRTVLHLANADKPESIAWTLDVLHSAGFGSDICDYVGLSLYPGIDDGTDSYTARWQKYADEALSTISLIDSRYGMRTLLCEIGMNNEYSLSADVAGVPAADLQARYIDQCNTDVAAFTDYLIANLTTESSTCDGLFYWEPETDYMKNYTKGACVSAHPGASWPRHDITPNAWWRTVSARSTFGSQGFTDYTAPDSGVSEITADSQQQPVVYYNLYGYRLPAPPSTGIYIERTPTSTRKLLCR